MGVMVNHRPAKGLPLTHGQTVEIETSTCFCHRSSGRPEADPWLKGGNFCKGDLLLCLPCVGAAGGNPGGTLQGVQEQGCGQGGLAVDERPHADDAEAEGLLVVLLQGGVAVKAPLHHQVLVVAVLRLRLLHRLVLLLLGQQIHLPRPANTTHKCLFENVIWI